MEPVPPITAPPPAPPPPATSVISKLFNIIAAPGEVVDEIKSLPPETANWLVPVAIYVVLGIISVCIIFAQPAIRQSLHDQQVKALDQQVQQGKITQAQEDQALEVMEKFMGPGMLAVFGSFGTLLGGFAWVFGWALAVWLYGRWFFRANFDYMKAVEVAGLSLVILALGMVVTALLSVIFGRLNATLSLALLVNDFDVKNRAHLLLGAVNLINLWHAAILALGLAKLSGGSIAKAFAVVFGFWLAIELLLILIGLGQFAL